jgi:hypothetical protein
MIYDCPFARHQNVSEITLVFKNAAAPGNCARIRFPWYVAGRRVKVVPQYALGFHLDAPPGSGTLLLGFAHERTVCFTVNCIGGAEKGVKANQGRELSAGGHEKWTGGIGP